MSQQPLGKLAVRRRTGLEPFQVAGAGLGFDVHSFWAWAFSDLVGNTTRGVLAEYLIARVLGLAQDDTRDAWAPVDLVARSGVKIQVKSAAFVQSWHQEAHSDVLFKVRRTRSWDSNTNRVGAEPERLADVYVFALLAHLDKATIDPLNVKQWEFYVLPAAVLNERKRSQHSITLRSLKALTKMVRYEELPTAIEAASKWPAGGPAEASKSA